MARQQRPQARIGLRRYVVTPRRASARYRELSVVIFSVANANIGRTVVTQRALQQIDGGVHRVPEALRGGEGLRVKLEMDRQRPRGDRRDVEGDRTGVVGLVALGD